MSLRLVTVGSLPPAWGGATTGGVAAVHASLTAALLAPGPVALAAVIAPNLAAGAVPPPVVLPLPAGLSGPALRGWYVETLERLAPDLVLYHHLAHLWAREHRRALPAIPYVGVVHSWTALTAGTPEARAGKAAILREVLPAAAALILPSRHALEEGQALAMPYPGEVHVVHNPVDAMFTAVGSRQAAGGRVGRRSWVVGRWGAAVGSRQSAVEELADSRPTTHDPRPTLPPADDRRPTPPRIAAVASLTPAKRLDLAIRACAALGASLVVAGEGAEEGALRALARDLGADVTFAGTVPPARLAGILAGCDALCVPSASESFGNVYAEALACGVPVVGFAPTLAEIAAAMGIDVGIGIPGNADADAVTQALHAVLSADWDRETLATRAAACFAAPGVAARYVEVLLKVGE